MLYRFKFKHSKGKPTNYKVVGGSIISTLLPALGQFIAPFLGTALYAAPVAGAYGLYKGYKYLSDK